MDGLGHLHAARLPQSVGQGPLEGLPLLGGGHGRLGMEHRVDHLLVELIGLAGVEQGVVEVGRPVVEGREQEAQLRRRHHPAGGAGVELVVAGEVAQLRLALLYRTDAADKVGEHGVRAVHGVVFGPVGHVVDVVSQQDQVVALLQLQGADELLIKTLPQGAVLQLAVPKGGEQPVLLAVRHLPGGEHDVDQVPAQSAGQGLLQQAQVLLRLLLGHGAQGRVQIGDDLPAAVDITSVDAADGALLRLEPAAQLADFLLIHRYRLACFLRIVRQPRL